MTELKTLEELKNAAEKEFEEQVDRWIRALAEREGISFDDLRQHLLAFRYRRGWSLKIVFGFPDHTPVVLFSDFLDHYSKELVAHLEDGKLIGNYRWYAYRDHDGGGDYSAENLGEALLFATWVSEEDSRAKWA